MKKGSKLYVEGKLETRKWQNQQGQDVYTTEIKVFQMEMLDGKPQGQQAAPQQGYQQAPQGVNHNAPLASDFAQQPQKINPQEPSIDFDDDIPF